MICSVRNIGNHYKSTSIVRNQEKSAELTINQQKSLEIFGNRQNSLDLKKSFPLQIAAWIWFARILYRVLMSCTDSRCFLVSLEMILLDSRRFVGILLIFRNLDEFEWSIWFIFEFGVIQISCYPLAERWWFRNIWFDGSMIAEADCVVQWSRTPSFPR